MEGYNAGWGVITVVWCLFSILHIPSIPHRLNLACQTLGMSQANTSERRNQNKTFLPFQQFGFSSFTFLPYKQ